MAQRQLTNSFPIESGERNRKVLDLRKRTKLHERIIQGSLFICGAISIFTTIGIVVYLGEEAFRFFTLPEVTLLEFFTGTVWQPQIDEFGILPLLTATLLTTIIAMLVAIPSGMFVAIYLSEYASPKVRSTIKPTLEILAGIPTVVLGYFALTWVTPILRGVFGENTVQIYNTASAGLVMGILILPLISSMVEDALSAVPNSLREGAYGLGATKFEEATQIVVPAALSGITAALILGMSRAFGEAMIVAIAAGAGPNFTLNPFEGAETMTGHIVRISGGDISYESVEYKSLFAIALFLFLVTLFLNLISQRIIARYREEYD